MYRGIIILFGILGVLLSLVLGLYSVVTWEIVAVLVAISLGIPSLILTYEKVKPEESIAQGKAERKHEKERIKLPTPSIKKRKIQNSEAETVPLRKEKEQKSALLPDTADITKLNIDDSLLDKIYEQAHRKATNRYHDAQFSGFTIQVFPFAEVSAKVTIYLDFYAKWADKICHFRYSDVSPQVKYAPPDRRPKFDSQRVVFTTLPWKKSPKWMQFLKRTYAKIGPFAPATMTSYHLRAFPSRKTYWTLSFSDNFSGNEYEFEWNGRGLDENSVKQLS